MVKKTTTHYIRNKTAGSFFPLILLFTHRQNAESHANYYEHITIKANYGNIPFPDGDCSYSYVHLTMMASSLSLHTSQIFVNNITMIHLHSWAPVNFFFCDAHVRFNADEQSVWKWYIFRIHKPSSINRMYFIVLFQWRYVSVSVHSRDRHRNTLSTIIILMTMTYDAKLLMI